MSKNKEFKQYIEQYWIKVWADIIATVHHKGLSLSRAINPDINVIAVYNGKVYRSRLCHGAFLIHRMEKVRVLIDPNNPDNYYMDTKQMIPFQKELTAEEIQQEFARAQSYCEWSGDKLFSHPNAIKNMKIINSAGERHKSPLVIVICAFIIIVILVTIIVATGGS